jgi:homoserine kinase
MTGPPEGGVAWSQRPVVVRAPATSANLGPGFDALGLALGLRDEVEARVTGDGLVIEVAGEGEETAGLGEAHLVVRAMRVAFGALGGQPPGLRLRCVNSIPHGRGLGSSAAAIVSGLLAARALVAGGEERLPDDAVLRLAVDIEGHPDNVAACLAGGLTIAWRPDRRPPSAAAPAPVEPGAEPGSADGAAVTEPGGVPRPAGEAGALEPGGPATGGPGRADRPAGEARLLRAPLGEALTAVLCVPPFSLSTSEARGVLPASIPHADAAANAGRSALLVAAMAGEPGALLDATEDFLHQPYRAQVMPDTADLLFRLRRARVPAVVSGAGPAVLALLVTGEDPAPDVVDSIARETGIAWHVIPLDIDRQGAAVQPGELEEYPPDIGPQRRSCGQAQNQGMPSAGVSPRGQSVLP